MLLAGSRADAQLYEVKPSRNDPNYRRRPATDPNATPPGGVETRVNVEIFAGAENAGFEAQRWESTFERAGVYLRIRSEMPGDKLSTHEKQLGKLREVTLVGRLERDGSLTFEAPSSKPANRRPCSSGSMKSKRTAPRAAPAARRSGD